MAGSGERFVSTLLFADIVDSTAIAERLGEAAWRARAICEAAAEIGLVIRSGVHTGEVELLPGNVRGLAVHVATRVMALAGPGAVLVSWATRDLLAGTAITFEDRGLHELKGLTGPRALFAVSLVPEPAQSAVVAPLT